MGEGGLPGQPWALIGLPLTSAMRCRVVRVRSWFFNWSAAVDTSKVCRHPAITTTTETSDYEFESKIFCLTLSFLTNTSTQHI